MSVLPDCEIEHLADNLLHEVPLIRPFLRNQLAPSSYDIRLHADLKVPHLRNHAPIDLRNPVADRTDPATCARGFLLLQGRFVLGSSVEWVNIPDYLVCRVEGKSSLARLGIQIHSAGELDPGYRGTITLEITNLGPDPILLWPDVKIAQLSFEQLSVKCREPYHGRYQGSDGPVASRYNLELTDLAEAG